MADSIFRKDGTAQGVAKQRLIESLAAPEKRVIYDPYAARFVLGETLIKLMGHKFSVWITQKFAPGFHHHLIARTRFIDDLVEQKVAEGVTQYVILGAGYDLRAHRLKLNAEVTVFEVDQPEVQQQKRDKLPSDLANAPRVKYVGIDFQTQTLKDRLLASGYDPKQPTIFTLEGVSQYITKEAVKATLADIVALTQNVPTTFFMSYASALLNSNPAACFGNGYPDPEKKAATVMDLSAKVGEPWISLYTTDEVEELLKEFGFRITQNKTLADLNETYFTPVERTLREDEIFKLEHFVATEKI